DADREALDAEAVAISRAHLGADHPLALELAMSAALDLAEADRARAALRPLVARYAALHPERAAKLPGSAHALGILDLIAGDAANAKTSFELVVTAGGDAPASHERTA